MMKVCDGCERHVLEGVACPFCSGSSAARAHGRKLMALAGAVMTPIVLAACYGGAPFEDADGDGFDSVEDCDDSNADVNPGAVEDCGDGIDNDCDGLIDDEDDDCGTDSDSDSDSDTD